MRIARTSHLFIAFSLCVAIAGAQKTQNSATVAAVPRLIRFAGSFHSPVSQPGAMTGATFAIYAQQEGGTPLWSEDQNVGLDANGNYTVLLGSMKNDGVPVALFTAGEERWLQVNFYAPERIELPRVLLVSVPYALKAGDAETLGGLPASAFMPANAPAASTGTYSTAAFIARPETNITNAPNQPTGWTSNGITISTTENVAITGDALAGSFPALSLQPNFPINATTSEPAMLIADGPSSNFSNTAGFYLRIHAGTPGNPRDVFTVSRSGVTQVYDGFAVMPNGGAYYGAVCPNTMACFWNDLGNAGIGVGIMGLTLQQDLLVVNASNGMQIGITNPLNPRVLTLNSSGLLALGWRDGTAPALKPNGTTLAVQLSDGSGTPAPVSASTFIATLSTPASSTAPCTSGAIWADANYVYICTGTNTIKRAALSTF